MREAILSTVIVDRSRATEHGRLNPDRRHFPPGAGNRDSVFSFSTANKDFHAPNEFFRLSSFRGGLTAWTRCFALLGQQPATHYAPFRSEMI